MHDLTIIKTNGGNYIDSREVAKAIEKTHKDLLRDIRGYIDIITNRGERRFAPSDFFVKSEYLSRQNKKQPCYLLSKSGCELVANKVTGEKGVMFTVAYVTKFNEMEAAEYAELEAERNELQYKVYELEAKAELPPPRLGEVNACARITIRVMRDIDATPESILSFLKNLYEPFDIIIDIESTPKEKPKMYTTKEIAEMLGIYSLSGNPHYQAVSCILNENIFISSEHKTTETHDFVSHIGTCIRYDDYAVQSITDWLDAHGYPNEIYGFERTYHVLYKA